MNKQKNQIFFLVAIIFVGLLYVYVEYLLLPQTGLLKEQTNHLTERTAYLQKLEENNGRLPALRDQVSDLSSQAARLEEKVPRELNKPEIMLTIYNLAKQNGLSPQSLTYDQPKDENGFTTMGLDFSCTGPEAGIYSLVDQFLKGNAYIFALDSMSIDYGEAEVSANMKLVAYGYKD